MQPMLIIFGPHIDHGGYYVINDVTELNIVVNHRIQKKKNEIIVNPCSQICLYFPSVSAPRAVFVY